MSKPKVQSIGELEDEMRAVARGERLPPNDAATPSYNSMDVLTKATAAKLVNAAERKGPRGRRPER